MIAHYNPLQRIGAGALGEVYRARDMKVGRTVALKLVPTELTGNPQYRGRFLEDAGRAASLSHPNIATLFEVGQHEGQYYLAYEFAAGRPLHAETSGRALNPRRALEIGIQLAAALAEAHARGVVHADLRPGNVIVTEKGSSKILDFGLTTWTEGGYVRFRAASSPDSLPPEAVAVVSYLSPEQAVGAGVDWRTDLFSLGVLLYELLTGRNPFAGSDAQATVLAVAQAGVPRASVVNPELPAELDRVLARALAKEPAARYQGAAELAADLRGIAAILDVRSGERPVTPHVIPLDDERPVAGRLWLLAAGVGAIAAGWWWLG